MAKIKQKYYAFKTAETNYNKRKVALANEFSKRLHELIKEGNLKGFEEVGKEMVSILGEEHSFTTTAIKVLYKLHFKLGDKIKIEGLGKGHFISYLDHENCKVYLQESLNGGDWLGERTVEKELISNHY